MFFADFEGHHEDARVSKTLMALTEHCLEMTVLGSFPMAKAAV